jgi:hypothetical protein
MMAVRLPELSGSLPYGGTAEEAAKIKTPLTIAIRGSEYQSKWGLPAYERCFKKANKVAYTATYVPKCKSRFPNSTPFDKTRCRQQERTIATKAI